MGRQMAADLAQEITIVQDSAVTHYVGEIAERIARNSDAMVPMTVKVVDSEEINALALPGGFIYVNTGLILMTGNEAELGAVLAHEIAHVAARHATESSSRARLFNVLTLPLVFVGGPVGMALRQAGALLVPVEFAHFSRKAEAEAGLLGIQYLFKAGYDPISAITLFEKLQVLQASAQRDF